MKSCNYIPTIKVGNEERESRLFKDLLSYTGNRESAKKIWAMTQIPEFMGGLSNIKYDQNGEPTINSLNKAININNLLQGKTTLLAEKLDLGAIDETGNPVKYNTYSHIIENVLAFNKENQNLVATVNKTGDGFYTIDVQHKTVENSEEPNKLMFSNDLNNQLRGIMRKLGFDVAVDNELIPNGVFTPFNATETAEKLKTVIRIAKGQRGEDAFPEEFSHLIIEGLTREPLVSRLLDALRVEGVVEYLLGEDYQKYYDLYKGDEFTLRKEAAAKVLSDHITGRKTDAPINGLLSRIWNWVKSKFRSLNESEVDTAISEANKGFARLASAVKDESILPLIDKQAVMESGTMYQVSRQVNKMEELAQEALRLASKRLRIIQLRSQRGKYSKRDLDAIKNLQNLIEKKKYADSCLAFLKDSTEQIMELNKVLSDLQAQERETDLSKIRKISTTLRRIKEFSEAYGKIIKDMTSLEIAQRQGDVDLDQEDAVRITNAASKISNELNFISNKYNELRFNTVFNFLKIYWGEDKIIDVGKKKGEKVTLEMILKMADKDINGIDRWINSMSDASDPLLSLIDKAVKVSQANRDQILEDALKNVRDAHAKLTKAGYTTDFMYERDEKGKLTGRLISDIDFNRFNKERQAYIDELKAQKLEYYVVKSKVEAWERKHTEVVVVDKKTGKEEILPDKSMYGKNVLSRLSPAQREYYDFMLSAKAALEDMLPSRYTNLYNAVQIRNDVTEAVASNISDPAKAAKIVLDNIKDGFVRRSDDTEFGESLLDSEKNKMLDFTDRPIEKLPIYYTSPLEDMDRLSTDFTSSIMAYAGMAINYNEMNRVVDVLELARDYVNDREEGREVQQTQNGDKVVESYRVVNKKFKNAHVKRGRDTAIGNRLDDYYASVLYGQTKRDNDQKTVKIFGQEIDVIQTLDTLKNYTGAVGLGLNLFSGISNVTMGKLQMFIESISGEYYNVKNSVIGKKNYYSLLPQYLAELNSTNKSGKMGLLIDKFNALDEFYDDLKRKGFYQGGLSRIIGSANLFILNNMGEHYLHTRNMLSMLDAYKVKDSTGREISLYDALEVEKSPEGNGVLKVKAGVTKLDGTAFTEEDFIKMRLRISKVNHALNGAFNAEDKGAVHRYALGRLAMQFRQWMPAHYMRRLSGTYYDASLDQYREGFYVTTGRFILDTMKDLRRANFEMATRWKSLSNHEKANIRRALTEIGIFALLTALISMIGPEKDRKGYWADRMIIYQLKRLKLETGVSIPFHPGFFKDAMAIVQSPAAAIRSANNIMGLLEFWNIFNEIESGRYKGWSEYEKNLVQLAPVYGQARKVLELGNEDYMFTLFNK